MSQYVDETCVRAGCKNKQTLVSDMDGNKPFIHQEFVQLPSAVSIKPMLAEHTSLEARHARDFTAQVE